MKKSIAQSQYITVLLLVLHLLFISCESIITRKNAEGKITALTITLNGENHTVDFAGGLQATVTYYHTTGASIDTITIKQITISDKATASVSNGKKIAISNNTVSITVTAQDSTKQVYTITLNGQSVEASIRGVVERSTIPGDLRSNSSYSNTDRQVLTNYKVGATITALFFTVEGKGTKDGTSWGNALPATKLKSKMDEISDAADYKVYLLLIASGTYTAGQELKMKNNVAIIGGWDKAGGWSKSTTEHTILSGDKKHRVFNNTSIQSTATLSNVTIAYGKGKSDGGGMYNTRSSPSIIRVTFLDNQASNGGGMYNENSSPSIIYSTFSNNQATANGGGMYNYTSNPYINVTTLSDNTAGTNGGGIYNTTSSSPLCINITLANNKAEDGGGMYNFNSPGQIIIHATFSKNTATRNGGGLYNDNNNISRPTTILNSILWGNTAVKGTQVFVDNRGGQDEAITLGYGVIDNGGDDGTGVGRFTTTDAGKVTVNAKMTMKNTDPKLGVLHNNGGIVKTINIATTGSAPNIGVYIGARISNNLLYLYYSKDRSTWYTDVVLSKQTTLSPNTINITYSDATGIRRDGRPDAGSYEAR